MLFELSIMPLGNDPHISDEIAEVIRVLDKSGLMYQLTPTATCIEGRWEDVIPVVRLCHARVRASCDHVVTLLKIEDDADGHNKLTRNVTSVEEKLGHALTGPIQ